MRGIVLIAVVGLVAVLGVRGVQGELLQDLGATFQQVAQSLAGAFPKVEARIVAVDGEEARIEGPGVAALRPGLELTAYRRGEVFRHPVTGQPLGHAERDLATLVVTAVEGDQATARVVVGSGGEVPGVGDLARITAGRLGVAVLPPTGVSSAYESADQTALLLVARFSGLLERTGRFVTVEPRRVLDVAGLTSGAPVASPLEAARRLAAPAVVTSRLVGQGRERALEVAWVSGKTGETLWSTRASLTRALLPPRFAWENTPEIERTFGLDSPVRGLALADLDGDQRLELVVGDERTASVYRWQENQGPIALPGVSFRPGGAILSVDAADVNGTGHAQVVVVDYQAEAGAARGTVLELVGQELRPIHETRGFLRIVRVGREPWLLEQDVGRREPFEGSIHRLVWTDGRYRAGPAIRVPPDVNLYGFALMRLTGAPEPEVVALTGNDHLGAWTAAGKRLWASGDRFGGAAITFAFNQSGRRDNVIQEGEPNFVGRVRGRLIPVTGDGDSPEVLVFENILPLGQVTAYLPGTGSALFTQGRIHRLRWKDGGFVRIWQSSVTSGYITDFTYGDLDADGSPAVVVGVIPRGLNLDALNPFARSRARLVLFELP